MFRSQLHHYFGMVATSNDGVVERTVRLHIRDTGTACFCCMCERSELLLQRCSERRRRHLQRHSPEVLAVGVRHLSPDGHAEPRGLFANRQHRSLVAGMPAACHVGARHQTQEAGLVAVPPRQRRLAEVAVHVDTAHIGHLSRTLQPALRWKSLAAHQ